MNDFICKICNKHCTSLKNHIKIHNILEKEYYDTYLLTDNKNLCFTCNKITKFKDIYKGYNKYCSKACLNKSCIHTNSVKNTKLNKYGNAYYNNPKKNISCS